METKNHVCPVWVGYFMANPLRKLIENPDTIVGPYILQGMKILEIGPAMGFFSIPMAKKTGKTGKVYCVDIQQKMLNRLRKRAIRKNVTDEIELILSSQNSMNIQHLPGIIDFTLLAYVVHEVPDQFKLFSEIAYTMKHGAKVLLLEPKGHVDELAWKESLEISEKCGFLLNKSIKMPGNRAAELIKE